MPANAAPAVSGLVWGQAQEKFATAARYTALTQQEANPMSRYTVAIFVPIGFFLFVFAGLAVTLYFRAMRERERQETLRKMVEKGIDIPEALLTPFDRPMFELRRGLVMIGAGIGVMVMLSYADDHDLRSLWGAGLIPTLMGVANLITWFIGRRSGVLDRAAHARAATGP
jgi:hypothetical protein